MNLLRLFKFLGGNVLALNKEVYIEAFMPYNGSSEKKRYGNPSFDFRCYIGHHIIYDKHLNILADTTSRATNNNMVMPSIIYNTDRIMVDLHILHDAYIADLNKRLLNRKLNRELNNKPIGKVVKI